MRALESALAISRASQCVEELKKKMSASGAFGRASRESIFPDIFTDIHSRLFYDSHHHIDDSSRAGVARTPEVRAKMANVLIDMAKALFDENGTVIKMPNDELAEKLAESYHAIRELKPFHYGNRHSLNMLIHCIASLDGFKARYGAGLDFRRMDKKDAKALLEGTKEEIATAFEHALDPNRAVEMGQSKESFASNHSSLVEIAGMQFIAHEQDDQQYLVTVNGGLVPRESVEKELAAHVTNSEKNEIFSEFKVKPSLYLNITTKDEKGNEIELKNKRVVDGYIIEKDGRAPLLCNGINSLTGLSNKNFGMVHSYLTQKLNKYRLTDLADESIARRLIDDAPEKIKPRLEYAAGHVRRLTAQMDRAVNELFEGKEPAAKPMMLMTMGGAGSGKSLAEKYIDKNTTGNFVKASLDDSRRFCDMYHVLRAVEHHSDDYFAVDDIAKQIRNWTADRALGLDANRNYNKDRRYNVLYDGSGIDYQARYKSKVAEYKSKGFKTLIFMVDTLMTTPKGREEVYPYPALKRVQKRVEEEKRALPWRVVMEKHQASPNSFMDAVEDPNVDKAVIFSNDGPKEKAYIVGETFDVENKTLKELREEEIAGTLNYVNLIRQWMTGEEDSIANGLSRNAPGNVVDNIPVFENDNAGLMAFGLRGVNGKPLHRILAVTDLIRLCDTAEKVYINKEAAGPDQLLEPSEHVAPFMTHTARDEQGNVSLQQAPESYVRKLMDRWYPDDGKSR